MIQMIKKILQSLEQEAKKEPVIEFVTFTWDKAKNQWIAHEHYVSKNWKGKIIPFTRTVKVIPLDVNDPHSYISLKKVRCPFVIAGAKIPE